MIPFCDHFLDCLDDCQQIGRRGNNARLEHCQLGFQRLLQVFDGGLVFLAGADTLYIALWLGTVRIGGSSGDRFVYLLNCFGEFDLMVQHT